MVLALSFASARMLWLLLVPGAMIAAYMAFQRRRVRYAVRFTNLELLSTVVPRTPGWRRHVPILVYLVALATLVLAIARPSIVHADVVQQRSVVLMMDVSGSMVATDVTPSRLGAAQS